MHFIDPPIPNGKNFVVSVRLNVPSGFNHLSGKNVYASGKLASSWFIDQLLYVTATYQINKI